MEACYGGTDVIERSCPVARGIDINTFTTQPLLGCGRGSFKKLCRVIGFRAFVRIPEF
jgi:hypothetical protein